MARRTQAQLAQTRQSIIDAATALFAERGFAHAQVAQIAERAGVGISAFYGQFRDKEELFLLIAQDAFEEVHAGVLEVRRNMNIQSPLDVLMGVQRTYDLVFEMLARHKEITMSILRSGLAAVPALEQLFWGICDAVADEMARDFARANADNVVNVDRPRDLSDAMVGMIFQLANRMTRVESLTPHQAAKVCTKFTLGALLMYMPHDTLHRMMPILATFPGTGSTQNS